jgi:hypothetical protein
LRIRPILFKFRAIRKCQKRVEALLGKTIAPVYGLHERRAVADFLNDLYRFVDVRDLQADEIDFCSALAMLALGLGIFRPAPPRVDCEAHVVDDHHQPYEHRSLRERWLGSISVSSF